jgi:hypothetical protein
MTRHSRYSNTRDLATGKKGEEIRSGFLFFCWSTLLLSSKLSPPFGDYIPVERLEAHVSKGPSVNGKIRQTRDTMKFESVVEIPLC